MVHVFSPSAIIYPPPPGRCFGTPNRRFSFFCFVEPAAVFGSFYMYVSMYCFLTCLGCVFLRARRGDFSYGLGMFDLSHEEVKRAVVCIYRFFSLHTSRCIRLFVPRNNNAWLQKEIKEKEKATRGRAHPYRKLPSPPYISHTFLTLPRFASGSNPSPTFRRLLAYMANRNEIPRGNPAFSRMLPLNSPAPSKSVTPLTDYPIAFMMEHLA